MSRFDYQRGRELELAHEPFYALVMAAMRRADSENLDRLAEAFPDVWEECRRRYEAPGALLPGERADGMMLVPVEKVEDEVTERTDRGERLCKIMVEGKWFKVLRDDLPPDTVLVEVPDTRGEEE